jgi:hypothetical protein
MADNVSPAEDEPSTSGPPGSAAPPGDGYGNGPVLTGRELERALQVGMSPHSVAVATDVDDVAMVEKAVDQRRRHNLVAKHIRPLLELLLLVSTVKACS